MNAITAPADLPFDWAPDMPGCRIVSEPQTPAQMHARATQLAVAAMEAATPSAGEVVAFRARLQAEEDAVRAENLLAHQARNAASHEAALERKAERMNVHAMRNAEASAEAALRRASRIAAHEARIEASRKTA